MSALTRPQGKNDFYITQVDSDTLEISFLPTSKLSLPKMEGVAKGFFRTDFYCLGSSFDGEKHTYVFKSRQQSSSPAQNEMSEYVNCLNEDGQLKVFVPKKEALTVGQIQVIARQMLQGSPLLVEERAVDAKRQLYVFERGPGASTPCFSRARTPDSLRQN